MIQNIHLFINPINTFLISGTCQSLECVGIERRSSIVPCFNVQISVDSMCKVGVRSKDSFGKDFTQTHDLPRSFFVFFFFTYLLLFLCFVGLFVFACLSSLSWNPEKNPNILKKTANRKIRRLCLLQSFWHQKNRRALCSFLFVVI